MEKEQGVLKKLEADLANLTREQAEIAKTKGKLVQEKNRLRAEIDGPSNTKHTADAWSQRFDLRNINDFVFFVNQKCLEAIKKWCDHFRAGSNRNVTFRNRPVERSTRIRSPSRMEVTNRHALNPVWFRVGACRNRRCRLAPPCRAERAPPIDPSPPTHCPLQAICSLNFSQNLRNMSSNDNCQSTCSFVQN